MDTKKIINRIERQMYLDYSFAQECVHYERMANLEWDLPSNLVVDWVVKRVATEPADIIKQACNIFDTQHPKFEILPRGPKDADNAEKLERWLEWQQMRADQCGETETSRLIMRHSALYDQIKEQIDYQPKTGNNEINDEPFRKYLYHPATVHSEKSGKRLKWVAVVNILSAGEVIEHWQPYADENTEESKKVKSAIDKLDGLLKDDDDTVVIYCDYTDDNNRWVFFCETELEELPEKFKFPDNKINIVNGDNPHGFVNWVIVKGSSGPVLESLHKSNLWRNQNYMDSLADSTVLRRAFFPLFTHSSPTGRKMQVDFTTDSNGVIENGLGETTSVNVPPQLDPGVAQIMDRNRAKMNSSSGIQNISSIDAVNVQAATIQTVVALRKTELEPYKRNAEKEGVESSYIFFRFMKKKNQSVVGYRTKKSDKGGRGDKMVVNPEDFDPDQLVISCELLENDPSNKMQLVNMYSQLLDRNFQIPTSEYIERLDMGDPDVLKKKWVAEQLEKLALKNLAAKKDMEIQLQMEVEKLKMMPPPPGPANPPNSPNQPVMPGGQLNNPANGGNSPMESAPQMTQTVMRGMNGQ